MKTRNGKIGTIATVAMLVAAMTGPTIALGAPPNKPKPIASGVVNVLDFDADWTQSMPNGPVYPALCQTEPHRAGPNEIAVITMSGFLAPSGGSNDFLQLKVAVSEDGWPFEALPGHSTIDGMSDGAAHVSTTKKLVLAEGVTYEFSAQFQTGAPVVAGFNTCQGTVTILRMGS